VSKDGVKDAPPSDDALQDAPPTSAKRPAARRRSSDQSPSGTSSVRPSNDDSAPSSEQDVEDLQASRALELRRVQGGDDADSPDPDGAD
jgi:hypothetical protein